MGRISRYSELFGKIVRYVRESGVGPVLETVRRNARERKAYQEWVRRFGTLTDEQRREYRSRIDEFGRKPLISIVLPVYNVDEDLLRKCIGSVTRQIYPHWQLCIADDASTKGHIKPTLQELAEFDDRIKIVFRESNGHISAASNSALELAEGEFTVLLDHDDELSEDAIYWVANELNEHPDTAMIYSDEDLMDESGVRSGPKFKPDFSRDLLYGINLVTHLSAYRTSILRQIGGFRVGYEGSQDYDLALRVVERLKDEEVRHIPKILYHWRITAGSLAHDLEAKPYAHESARRAIREHLERTGRKAEVVETGYLHRVRYKLPDEPPKVSLILSSRGAGQAANWAEIVRSRTDYPDLEIVEVNDREAWPELEKEPVKSVSPVLQRTAILNAAAARAGGEVLCFLDTGLQPISREWLRELVTFVLQPDIGVVGPRLHYADNTVAGGGLLIGVGGVVGTAHEGFLRKNPGNMSRNRLICNYSAVSSSCLVIRRDMFEAVGGFDEENLSGSLYDADLCLRVREKGSRVTVTPFAELKWINGPAAEHYLVSESDRLHFETRWAKQIANDPFHNPNLSKERTDFSIKV